MSGSARAAALALAAAAIAPAAAMLWPPEIIPAGRLVVALLAGAAVVLAAARGTAPGREGCRAGLLLLPLAVAAVVAAPGRARALDEAALGAALLAFGLLGTVAGRDPRAGRLLTTTLAALGTAAALVAMARAHPDIDSMWDPIIRRERELMAARQGFLNKLRHQPVVDTPAMHS